MALVKPQFEAGRAAVARGRGVVRDSATHKRVVAQVREFATAELEGCAVLGAIRSPITGADGNAEWLLALARAEHRLQPIDLPADIDDGPAGNKHRRAEAGGIITAIDDDGLVPAQRVERPQTAAARAARRRNERGRGDWGRRRR